MQQIANTNSNGDSNTGEVIAELKDLRKIFSMQQLNATSLADDVALYTSVGILDQAIEGLEDPATIKHNQTPLKLMTALSDNFCQSANKYRKAGKPGPQPRKKGLAAIIDFLTPPMVKLDRQFTAAAVNMDKALLCLHNAVKIAPIVRKMEAMEGL